LPSCNQIISFNTLPQAETYVWYGLVCQLWQSLYGLNLSPKVWFGKFSKTTQIFGLK